MLLPGTGGLLLRGLIERSLVYTMEQRIFEGGKKVKPNFEVFWCANVFCRELHVQEQYITLCCIVKAAHSIGCTNVEVKVCVK